MNNILMQLSENVSLNTIKLMNATAIANAYVANYVAALVLIRAHDEKGIKLLNDKRHAKLNSFSTSMSRPNFWGFIIFNSDIKNIKKIIQPSTAAELEQSAGRIVSARRIKLQNYTTLTDEKINWTDAAYSIKLLKVRFNLGYSKLENIANGIYHWESLDEMAKGDLLYNAFSYLMQSDNESDLLPRLRLLTNNKYLTVNSIVSTMGQKLNKVFRMMEDEGGGDIGTGDPGPGVNVTTPDGISSKDVGNLPMKFEKGKIIKRRKRNWKVRKWKDPLAKKKDLGDYSNVKIN
jgi:hypothetical protein